MQPTVVCGGTVVWVTVEGSGRGEGLGVVVVVSPSSPGEDGML